MGTVLRKELREGWLFLLINVLVLAGTPVLGRLFLPRHWDADVTSIFYAIMFGVFVPFYLVILAAGLVQDENTPLVRGLPVRPWKVAVGKLLYLALNFAVLESICLSRFLVELRWPTGDMSMDILYSMLWLGSTGVAALAAFAFASFLPRKSYAFFASLLVTLLAMGSLIYLLTLYLPAVAADRALQAALGAALLFLFAAAVVLYHDLIRQARRRWVRAAAAALLLPAVAGGLWLRAPLWLKQMVIGNPYALQPAGDNLFVAYYSYSPWSRWHEGEPYLFDAAAGTIRPFPFLGDAEFIAGTDPRRSLLYTATHKTISRDNELYRKYSSMDLATGKTKELGLLPYRYISIEGDIARWGHTDANTKDCFFGFKDLARGTTFEYAGPGCRYRTFGPEGVLYGVAGAEGTVWMFVDYATARPREAFRGEYYNWPWIEAGGFFLFEGARDFSEGIPCDRDVFRWDPASGAMQKLGPGRPLVAKGDQVVLIRGKKDGPKMLALYRNGQEVSTLPTAFLGGYALGFMRQDGWTHAGVPWRLELWTDKDREVRSLGLLSIEGDRLAMKAVPLPRHLREMVPVPGSGDVLLYLREREQVATEDWNERLFQVYRLDPATGKMRRLV